MLKRFVDQRGGEMRKKLQECLRITILSGKRFPINSSSLLCVWPYDLRGKCWAGQHGHLGTGVTQNRNTHIDYSSCIRAYIQKAGSGIGSHADLFQWMPEIIFIIIIIIIIIITIIIIIIVIKLIRVCFFSSVAESEFLHCVCNADCSSLGRNWKQHRRTAGMFHIGYNGPGNVLYVWSPPVKENQTCSDSLATNNSGLLHPMSL